jgi:hypothetical protein
MTIKSLIFPIALLAGLAITATVTALDASSEAGLAVQVLAVGAANAGPPATPILLAQYNPCTGGRCR